jgi:predicted 2-oxoglutarate/Fe(II)-dependent dioxygenase YbiX
METTDISSIEKTPLTANSAWPFNLDQVENWAYMDKLFSPEECAKIIEIGEKKILTKASVIDNKVVEETRDSSVTWLYSVDDMDWVYRRVTDAVMSLNNRYFNFDLFGFTEGFQFTRYDAPSGFYGMHIDKLLNGLTRKLSLTIQLSDPESYEGGELALQFSKEPDIMPKEQGKMVVFPSYVLHEVKPVTQGTRYSLVAWISGKPFK